MFSLLIDYQVLEYIVALNRKERTGLQRQLLRIRDFPANLTDYFESDVSGRSYCINVFGGHAIKYWIDDAARQIKVLEIRHSDHG